MNQQLYTQKNPEKVSPEVEYRQLALNLNDAAGYQSPHAHGTKGVLMFDSEYHAISGDSFLN